MTTSHSAEAIRQQIKQLDIQLDHALHLFADFEAGLNEELKHAASPEQRTALFAKRSDYEVALGIEDLVIKIDDLRAQLRALE